MLASLILIAAIVGGTQIVTASQAEPTTSSEGITPAASGLANPRGFVWGADGTLYVAEARVRTDGGATPAAPAGTYTGELDGAVVRIEAGCPVVFQGNLPSVDGRGGPDLGPSGLAFVSGQLFVLDEGGGALHGNPLTPDGIYRIDGGGSAQLVADIGAWVDANPVAELPDDVNPGGDLTSMVAHDGALLVLESNGGQLLRVTTDGEITRVVDLSGGDLLPRGIAVGPGGRVYVGLSAPGDGASKVVMIDTEGNAHDVWADLGRIADVAVAQDGTLYALQMGTSTGEGDWSFVPGTGSVVRQTGPDSSAPVATGFDTPIALAFGPDQGLYVSSPAVGGGMYGGSIVRLDTHRGQVMTMTDDVLAGSACVPEPAPTDPATPQPSPTDEVPPETPEADEPDTSAGATVDIANFAFGPDALTVSAGTTVTWTNYDTSPHTVTANDGAFDSGTIAPGETFTFTFESEGSFDYICSFHPNMTGNITVTGHDATSATSDAANGSTTAEDASMASDDVQEATVSIENLDFGPNTLTITAGTTVTWVNNDTTSHTASAADKAFDSGNLAPGDSYSFTFDAPGTYAYACMYHPNMTATIIVE